MKICSIEDCGKKVHARGWCKSHYMRWNKYGDTNIVAPNMARNGSPRARGDGSIDKYGYVRFYRNGKKTSEHRYVMEQILGRPLTSDEYVHHKNGVRHDNRPENLELWRKAQPPGQRIEDQVSWAIELLQKYQPNALDTSVRDALQS